MLVAGSGFENEWEPILDEFGDSVVHIPVAGCSADQAQILGNGILVMR